MPGYEKSMCVFGSLTGTSESTPQSRDTEMRTGYCGAWLCQLSVSRKTSSSGFMVG